MLLEDYLDFVGPNEIRIRGHRIGIEHVVELFRDGYSPEQIAQEFPGLSLEKIYATIAYYLHNKTEVDAYIERINALAEEEYQRWAASPSPLIQRLRAVKAARATQSSEGSS
jgi:uncharacterized protein (DUF433 family)